MLSFQNNKICELPKFKFNTLLSLNLNNNEIEKLENDDFERSELPSLEKLFLGSNAIKAWPEDICLEKLLKLNLSDNQLTNFVNINRDTVP